MCLFDPLVVSSGHPKNTFVAEFSGNFQGGVGFNSSLAVKHDVTVRLGRL